VSQVVKEEVDLCRQVVNCFVYQHLELMCSFFVSQIKRECGMKVLVCNKVGQLRVGDKGPNVRPSFVLISTEAGLY